MAKIYSPVLYMIYEDECGIIRHWLACLHLCRHKRSKEGKTLLEYFEKVIGKINQQQQQQQKEDLYGTSKSRYGQNNG